MTRTASVLVASALVIAGAALAIPACVVSYDDCHDLLTCAADGGSSGGCQKAEDCDDHNACTDDACTKGACTHTPKDGPGPNDGLPCTKDLCTAGHETHDAVSAGTACSPGSTLKCDGSGNCPACTQNADCGTADPSSCSAPVCSAQHTCMDMVQVGKKLTDPTAGDCKGVFCDANGLPKSQSDPTDTPPPKGQVCFDDGCGPDGAYPPSASGTPCTQGGKVCDGSGHCVGCVSDADCAAPTPSCKTSTHTCVDSCANGVKDGNETGVDCGGSCPLKCKGATCGGDGECTTGFCAAGVCCDSACTGDCQACNLTGKVGTCTAVAANTNTAACPAPYKVCSMGGACKSAKGGPCTTNGDCSGTNLNCAFGACRLTQNGACTDDYACRSGYCETSFSSCAQCFNDGDCSGKHCDMSTFVCQSAAGDPCGADTDCAAGNGVCTNGICAVPNGGSCTADSACASNHCGVSHLCTACAIAGDCPSTTCSSGVCLLPSGRYCTSNAQCNSGVCAGFPAKCG